MCIHSCIACVCNLVEIFGKIIEACDEKSTILTAINATYTYICIVFMYLAIMPMSEQKHSFVYIKTHTYVWMYVCTYT